MYLKNLLTITGRSQAKKSDLLVKCAALNKNHKNIVQQGSRYLIAAFLLLGTILPFSGCDSPGLVGDDLNADEEDVVTQVVDLENVSVIEAESYTGKLSNSAVGFVDDPAYGTIRAIALLKPSISKSEVDSIGEDDVLRLKVVFSEEEYGNAGSTASYEIFEVAEPWRGNELRYSTEVTVDFNSKVGEFQVTNQDTVEVDLSEAWTEKYLEFYNAESADSLYRSDFRGLAIVPSESNSRLQFLSHTLDVDDTDSNNPVTIPGTDVSLIVSSTVDPDEETRLFRMRDWGFTFVRENEPEDTEGLVLHSGERVLRVNLSPLQTELESNNVVGAQLIFGTNPVHVSSSFPRPQSEALRAFVFSDEPSDLRAEMFLNSSSLNGSLDEEQAVYKLDVTNFILNEIFGDGDQGAIYMSLPENGILYTTHLYDLNGPENLRPRLVITSVKSDS